MEITKEVREDGAQVLSGEFEKDVPAVTRKKDVAIEKKPIVRSVDDLFAEIITKSHLTEDIVVGENLTVRFKVLSSKEFISSEMVQIAAWSGVSQDIVAKVRNLSRLAWATEAINGISVEEIQLPDPEMDIIDYLIKKYEALPTPIINRLVSSYYDLAERQADLLKTGAFEDNLENFTTPPGDR